MKPKYGTGFRETRLVGWLARLPVHSLGAAMSLHSARLRRALWLSSGTVSLVNGWILIH